MTHERYAENTLEVSIQSRRVLRWCHMCGVTIVSVWSGCGGPAGVPHAPPLRSRRRGRAPPRVGWSRGRAGTTHLGQSSEEGETGPQTARDARATIQEKDGAAAGTGRAAAPPSNKNGGATERTPVMAAWNMPRSHAPRGTCVLRRRRRAPWPRPCRGLSSSHRARSPLPALPSPPRVWLPPSRARPPARALSRPGTSPRERRARPRPSSSPARARRSRPVGRAARVSMPPALPRRRVRRRRGRARGCPRDEGDDAAFLPPSGGGASRRGTAAFLEGGDAAFLRGGRTAREEGGDARRGAGNHAGGRRRGRGPVPRGAKGGRRQERGGGTRRGGRRGPGRPPPRSGAEDGTGTADGRAGGGEGRAAAETRTRDEGRGGGRSVQGCPYRKRGGATPENIPSSEQDPLQLLVCLCKYSMTSAILLKHHELISLETFVLYCNACRNT